MRSARGLVILGMIAVMAVAGCSRDRSDKEPPQLLNIKSSGSPDEFQILPTKPLEQPQDYATLPTPTPGGTNRVDVNPNANAIASLGGNPSRIQRGTGISRGDAGLVNHATRFGVAQDIRPLLAAEDLEFRRDNKGRILERALNVNVYYKAYQPQSLDQHRELERWRRLGVRTPAAPPEESLVTE
ncbi:DUF3035 domain-containing protein [Actibacterium pelagium]|uniref:Beta-barrel assembly machine subunit BamF n=1 Tax=Actibacterium pelagium TaxID=2029103 RepID=A0A917AH91_9RHOB|nr:DUF3035 domain-containing protein [Actibacterium pelagium]GGE53599.1 hypothetical protein GCM10011517_21650 [Actibacterium pelagium]